MSFYKSLKFFILFYVKYENNLVVPEIAVNSKTNT